MKNIILCDLDGTLADIKHRRHFVENGNKQWAEFHAACIHDTPIESVIEIIEAIIYAWHGHIELWVVSGRSDAVYFETVTWLNTHDIKYDKLLMRKAGDNTPDDMLKESWVTSGLIPLDRVHSVFDDRSRVVAMWRRLGLTCFQVAPGDF
jgi:hypothetical protein